MARTPLSAGDVAARLAELPGWTHEDGHLKRTFEFPDFRTAFGFMASAATMAEKLDHHPNWSNVYRTVNVELWTHDANGLTELDFALAGEMNRLSTPVLGD